MYSKTWLQQTSRFSRKILANLSGLVLATFLTLTSTLFPALFSTLFSTTASADSLETYISVATWQSALAGTIQDGSSEINMETDLLLDDERSNIFILALEHPVPVLPNIQVMHSDLDINASSILTRSIDFDGISFSIDEEIQTEADLTHIDVTMYYQVLDNWVSLDLGITARMFDGNVEIRSLSGSASEALDQPIPLLYGKLRFDLPLSGLAVAANVKSVGYRGDSIIDYVAKIAYENGLGIGVELGYRGMELQLEDISDFTADLEVTGPYAGFSYRF